jgi:hypothetical protein
MSVTYTITETRPSTNVPFYQMPVETINYIQKYNNVRTGNKGQAILSEDQLTRTTVELFATQADMDIFQADAVMSTFRQNLDAYNTTNNITITRTTS